MASLLLATLGRRTGCLAQHGGPSYIYTALDVFVMFVLMCWLFIVYCYLIVSFRLSAVLYIRAASHSTEDLHTLSAAVYIYIYICINTTTTTTTTTNNNDNNERK